MGGTTPGRKPFRYNSYIIMFLNPMTGLKEGLLMPKKQKFKEIRIGRCKTRQYCVAFAYPYSGPIVIKGSRNNVQNYVLRNLSICHFHLITYDAGLSRLSVEGRT